MAIDPYKVLGVSRTASDEDIKNAYRKLARKLHPDLNPGNKESEQRFKDISAAYDLIGTAEKRAKFERGEEEQRRGTAGGGPFYYETQGGQGGRYSRSFGEEFEGGFGPDVFEALFRKRTQRGTGARRGESYAFPGQDAQYSLQIDFKEAVLGAKRDLTLPNGKRLKINIPPGVKNGTTLRFSGEGEPGIGGGPPGDAYITLQVTESGSFHRVDQDLEMQLPVSLSEAILGGEVQVPTVEGAVTLKIPPGVNTGTRLRVRGNGVREAISGRRGDLYAIVQVMLPDQIDPELKEAIREWSERHPYKPRGRRAA